MYRIRNVLLAITMLFALLTPHAAFAYGLFDNACKAPGAASSATCTAKNSPEQVSGSNGILAKATKLVSEIAGIAAVILIVVSALFFVLAEGDPAKTKGARDTLIGAIVGIVIVLASQGILIFVLNRV